MTAPPPSSSIPPPVGTPHPPGQGQPGPAGYPAAPPPGQAPSWSPPPPQPPPQTWAEIPMRPGAYQQPAPVPGVPVVPPLIPPQTGQMVVGWEVFKPRPGCFHCVGLSFTGWLSVFILLICFWPLAWTAADVFLYDYVAVSSAVPCVMEDCFTELQRPIYGWPQAYPSQPYQTQVYDQTRDANAGQPSPVPVPPDGPVQGTASPLAASPPDRHPMNK